MQAKPAVGFRTGRLHTHMYVSVNIYLYILYIQAFALCGTLAM